MDIITYTIEDFNRISNDNFNNTITKDILDKILNISDKVSAPEYNKTPRFVNNKYSRNKNKNKSTNSEEDWEIIRSFKKTNIVKKQGIDANIVNIQKLLNKLTDETYKQIQSDIIKEIDIIINNDYDLKEINKIPEQIFAMASSNSFYSKIYARLYLDIISKFEFIKNSVIITFDKLKNDINTIDFCNPEEDYDKFCQINKDNTTRKALLLFHVNLMNLNVITSDFMMNVLWYILKQILTFIKQDNKKPIVDELSELLFIIVTNGFTKLSKHKKWSKLSILDEIEKLSDMDTDDYPSISNKTIFKCMDIVENIEEQMKLIESKKTDETDNKSIDCHEDDDDVSDDTNEEEDSDDYDSDISSDYDSDLDLLVLLSSKKMT